MPNRGSESKSSGHRSRTSFYILLGCVGLSLLLHGLSVVQGFGEPDAARFTVLAEEWQQTGKIHTYSYHIRTSPMYIHSLKVLLDLGVPLKIMPALLNWLSVLVGSMMLIPLYLLWRNLTRPSISFLGCLLFSLSPAFWLANIYGMAHLPSFALFILSLLLLAVWVEGKEHSKNVILWTAVLLAILSVCLKADLILCFGAYLGLVLCLKAASKRNILIALAIPLVSLLGVVLYAKFLPATSPILTASVSEWKTSFPFTFESLKDPVNRMIPVRSTGLFLFGASLAGAGYCLIRRRHRLLLVFALSWALPLLLFWSLKMGNSARHMMAGFCPLMFLAAVMAGEVLKNSWARWAVVLVILAGNYFSSSDGGTDSPTAELHRLKNIVNEFTQMRHPIAQAFVEVDGVENKVYAGSTTIPYVEFEAFVYAESFSIVQLDPKMYRLEPKGKRPQFLQIQKVMSPALIGPSDNWFLFSMEPGVNVKQKKKWLKYFDDPRFDKFRVIDVF
jgi:hypothetical protein